MIARVRSVRYEGWIYIPFRGHFVLALQLRGQAGANQVPDAERALVQSLGGPASSAVTHVLERTDL